MRRKLTIISISAIFVLTATSVVLGLNGYFTQGSGQAGKIDSADTTQGLVGYWNFDEGTGQTANDSSDSNNDGTRGANSSVGTDDPTWTTGPSTGSGQATPNQDINRGLVGYWDFSESTGQTANDSSDSNNDGTRGASSSVGTDDPTWTTGPSAGSGRANGGALDFDGVDDVVRVNNSTSIDELPVFTLALWFNTDVAGRLLEKEDGGSQEYRLIGGINSIRLQYIRNGGDWLSQPVGVDWTGTWHHMAVTYDSSSTANDPVVYIDGVSQIVSETGAPGVPGASDAPLFIGGRYIGANGVDGKLDEVRIYNRALSASEIRYLYNRGGPVGHWKFDEGSGTTAFDSTDITNDGTITGATYTQGQYGTALNFDGSDDVVTVTNANPIDFDIGLKNAVTFSSWIRADTAGEGTGGQIIFKRTNTWLRVDTLSSGKLDLEASIDLATTNATINVSSAITQSTWHHVVMTYADDSDDEIELYVDGLLVGTSTNGVGAPVLLADDTNNLLIAGTITNNFDGLIDDVRVFGYGRTPEEILQDYNAGLSTHFR